MTGRRATIERKTKETAISLTLDLDGEGRYAIQTGIGFFDHLLTHLAFQGCFDLEIKAEGDLEVDAHHTVEDVGVVFGQALTAALGERKGISRYGSAVLPMDDALVLVAVDLSGRPYLNFDLPLGGGKIGSQFEAELGQEFFAAVSRAGITIHLQRLAGENRHHLLEAAFKAAGRALRAAVALDPRQKGLPSTKGAF